MDASHVPALKKGAIAFLEVIEGIMSGDDSMADIDKALAKILKALSESISLLEKSGAK